MIQERERRKGSEQKKEKKIRRPKIEKKKKNEGMKTRGVTSPKKNKLDIVWSLEKSLNRCLYWSYWHCWNLYQLLCHELYQTFMFCIFCSIQLLRISLFHNFITRVIDRRSEIPINEPYLRDARTQLALAFAIFHVTLMMFLMQ